MESAPESVPESAPAPACRHEYVLIFQRKLKGLERRLTATKAWLPVGFKTTDFSHLGEGSYCFCSKCRARLFPKRTNAEKAQAKAALAAEKALALAGGAGETGDVAAEAGADASALDMSGASDETLAAAVVDIHVEELELESVQLEDLEEGSVPLDEEGSCSLTED
jgi:hypothetical protein